MALIFCFSYLSSTNPQPATAAAFMVKPCAYILFGFYLDAFHALSFSHHGFSSIHNLTLAFSVLAFSLPIVLYFVHPAVVLQSTMLVREPQSLLGSQVNHDVFLFNPVIPRSVHRIAWCALSLLLPPQVFNELLSQR